MADGPVQIVLNPDRFRTARASRRGGGPGTDFFRGRNAEFAAHREDLLAALSSVLKAAETKGYVNVLVVMRPDALAKSHRPFGKLFSPSRASHVGTAAYGELIFAVEVKKLREVAREISIAEEVVPWAEDAQGVPRYTPSINRCEASAIERIELWKPEDHRGFTISEAESWIDSGLPNEGISVELLRPPRVGAARSAHLAGAANLLQLQERAGTVEAVEQKAVETRGEPALAMKFGPVPGLEVRDLISLAEANPAVKRVRLDEHVPDPPEIEMGDLPDLEGTLQSGSASSSPRATVGVIDGGVIGPLRSYVVARSDLVAPEHRSQASADHGALVSGIVALGSGLNPNFLPASEDCAVYDIAAFPTRENLGLYYLDLEDFFSQLDAEVQRAKETSNVRVFNLSWNLLAAPGSLDYTLAAARLDSISLEHDVIFVMSGGNLPLNQVREEWPPGDTEALAVVAQSGSPDGVLSPAESIMNLSVSSLNPPGLVREIEGAPARNSRRGKSVASALKPDLAAFGGSLPSSRHEPTGLKSMNSSGRVVGVSGTSFAAPVVSRYLATLNAAISGEVQREALIALAVHHSEMPPILKRKAFANIARSFVGYGMVPSVDATLQGVTSAMTFVLSDVIQPGKAIDFPFVWPPSLTLPGGRCRGAVRLTLVARPSLDYAHGDEMVRINLDAALKQAKPDGTFERRTEPTHQFFSGFRYANERTLATELGKWFPIKSYVAGMPRGRGASSDWKVELNYLTRAGEAFPEEGVEFALVVTIADIDGLAPVFDEMRLALLTTGVRISDLRTAVQVPAS